MSELRRRWVSLMIGGWAVLLLVLAAYGGEATVAEQRDVAAARAAVDRAAIDLIRVSGQGVVVSVSDYRFVGDCRISLVRDGAEYQRIVRFLTPPGAEAELVETIADGLSPGYQVSGYGALGGHRLSGSGPGFVQLSGVASRGMLQVRVTTGCRPVDGPVTTMRTPPSRPEVIRMDEVLNLLGVPPGQPRDPTRWRTESVRCGAGALRRVEFTAPSIPDRPLGDVADLAPPDARVLVREPQLLAYRQGGVSVVADARDSRLRITTTAVDC